MNKSNGIFWESNKIGSRNSLARDQTTVMNKQLLRAAHQLSFIEYESFKAEWQHAENE